MFGILWLFPLLMSAPPDAVLLAPPAALSSGGLVTDEAVQGKVLQGLETALRARTVSLTLVDAQEATAPPPPAPAIAPTIVALRERAESAARNAEYGEAVRHYGDLVDALEGDLLQVGSIAPLVEARLELARLFQGTGEPRLMSDELLRVARLAPTLELDLRRYPPPLVEGLAAAQAQLTSEPHAEVSFGVSPQGTRVYVDGVGRCEAPCVQSVAAGPHVVWLAAPGHQPAIRVLRLVGGSHVVVEATLERDPLHAVSAALLEEIQGAARTESGRLLAQGLLRETGAQVALLVGILPLEGGYVVALRRFGEGEGLAYGFVETDLATLDSVCAALAEAAVTAKEGEVQGTGATAAIRRPSSPFAPDEELFGFAPARITPEEDGAARWVWLTLGGAALVATVGASVAGAFALLSPAEQQQAPDTVRIAVEVAP
ncbi:MAG: PEGA domain-containing protein [Myxococcota bacterium]